MRYFFGLCCFIVGICCYGASLRAAPFCVQAPGVKSFCYYYDPQECRREAVKLGGSCYANRSEINIPEHTYGSFCIVLATGNPQCLYEDYRQCDSVAKQQNGICITKRETLSPIEHIRQNRMRRSGDQGMKQTENLPDQNDNQIPGLPKPHESPLFHPGLDIRLNN